VRRMRRPPLPTPEPGALIEINTTVVSIMESVGCLK
jgi:hypothetical protein